jgi:hypothetical protein
LGLSYLCAILEPHYLDPPIGSTHHGDAIETSAPRGIALHFAAQLPVQWAFEALGLVSDGASGDDALHVRQPTLRYGAGCR